jgi:hypothetical protein
MHITEVRTQVIERLYALPLHEQKVVARTNFGFTDEEVEADSFADDYLNLLENMGTDGIVEMWEDLNNQGAIVSADGQEVSLMPEPLRDVADLLQTPDEAAAEQAQHLRSMEQMYERMSRADQGDE